MTGQGGSVEVLHNIRHETLLLPAAAAKCLCSSIPVGLISTSRLVSIRNSLNLNLRMLLLLRGLQTQVRQQRREIHDCCRVFVVQYVRF